MRTFIRWPECSMLALSPPARLHVLPKQSDPERRFIVYIVGM